MPMPKLICVLLYQITEAFQRCSHSVYSMWYQPLNTYEPFCFVLTLYKSSSRLTVACTSYVIHALKSCILVICELFFQPYWCGMTAFCCCDAVMADVPLITTQAVCRSHVIRSTYSQGWLPACSSITHMQAWIQDWVFCDQGEDLPSSDRERFDGACKLRKRLWKYDFFYSLQTTMKSRELQDCLGALYCVFPLQYVQTAFEHVSLGKHLPDSILIPSEYR